MAEPQADPDVALEDQHSPYYRRDREEQALEALVEGANARLLVTLFTVFSVGFISLALLGAYGVVHAGISAWAIPFSLGFAYFGYLLAIHQLRSSRLKKLRAKNEVLPTRVEKHG